jgi:hypothetical protein
MKHGVCLLLATLVLAGCGESKKEAKKPVDTNENYSSGNPVTAPVDYLGAVNKARKAAVRNIDLAYVKNAIQLYQAQEDHYPPSLDDLVKKHYIAEIPTPRPGSRLDYNAKTGEIKFVRQ